MIVDFFGMGFISVLIAFTPRYLGVCIQLWY